ncbi:MAG: glutamate racemase [Candidatus Berkelbacteria bacterium]|nr:glutamate racemase [Candidatus Berkelbacteria bacterium]
MNNQPIGVLDSGIGGLSILKEIIKKFPHESTIYLADSLNCPYGNRSEKEIYNLSRRLVEFLVDQKVKIIIIACNTITVTCLDRLRKDFPNLPIIGTVPVIKTAVSVTKNKKIGILSTIATSKSDYQKNLINKFAGDCEVLNLGTDKLVPLVEKGDLESGELKDVLKSELWPFLKAGIDVLVLGCSHFPFLEEKMQEILGSKVLLLDSGAAIARQVERVLTANKTLSKKKSSSHIFYTTGEEKHFRLAVNKLMREQVGKVGLVKGMRF